ncbi:hypothetical protein EXIGLDRAFT_721253 [Exidia glandulosa HHB12029]|uniref:Uncharacterized protein n=1 Tax=Exidia glandulosa HHB12029 TaxID=1314781 RepID=A0A165NAT0_EXIGL|nr:hypothetical protein EXIGLDRAFT_721253 [Exidia glandulosa HHB12029]
MSDPLADAPQWLAFLNANTSTHAAHDNFGRRQLKLALADQFWKLSKEQRNALPATTAGDPLADMPDPFDFPDAKTSVVVKCKGIVLRTDFTNDEAWSSVRAAIEATERDGWKALSDDVDGDDGEESSGSSDGEGEGDNDDEMEVDAETAANTAANAEPSTSTAESEPDTRALIFLSDPRFDGLSNIAALRLLNDVRITRSIERPLSHSGKSPAPHRLIARDGLREVYMGPQLWIYDAKSNTDRTVRLVERAGAMYGTATADSWRAKADHIWELQINMDAGMGIDFGGRDNWTAAERARNLQETET